MISDRMIWPCRLATFLVLLWPGLCTLAASHLGTTELLEGEPSRDSKLAPATICTNPVGVTGSIPVSQWCNSTADPSTVTDYLTVRDNGDNTANFLARIGSSTLSGTLSLASPNQYLYGKNCTFLFMGTVLIHIRRVSSAVFVPNNVQTWLSKLGVANIQALTGSLTVYADHTPLPLTVRISPTFFTSLKLAAAVTALECQNCVPAPNVPPTGASALASLPGLTSLQQFWNWQARNSAQTSIIVQGTAFLNFSSTLPNVLCSPGLLNITDNRNLTSLAGLNQLNTTLRPGPTVQIEGNAPLASPASVSALVPLAGCSTISGSPLTSPIIIATQQCRSTCWRQYCTYASTGACSPCAPPPPAPSPPPPPPPAVCTPPQSPFLGVVCGRLDQALSIAVLDSGDGTCTAALRNGTTSSAVSCTSLLFGSVCTSIQASILLTFARRSTAVPYSESMGRWLDLMGLGNASIIAQPLTIYVEHGASVPVPQYIQPVFFQRLSQVGALVVSECSGCAVNPNAAPPASALLALPGLVSLRQMRDFTPGAGFLGSLIIQNTAMGTLASFQGLVCPPGLFNIVGNRQLASFTGLQNLGFPSFLPGVNFNAVNNAMTSPASIQQIRVLAGCPTSTSSTQRSNVFIATSGCAIDCWNKYCSYANAGQCTNCTVTPPPPPPPLPPSPPPGPPPPPRPPPPSPPTPPPPPSPPPPSPPPSPPPPSPPPSPPPPSPPPASCPTPSPFNSDPPAIPDCTTPGDYLIIVDLGNGTCQAKWFDGTSNSIIAGDCTANLFGRTCTYLGSDLWLVAANANNLDIDYIPPDFQKYFNAIGIGSVTTLKSMGMERADWVGYSAPPPGAVISVANTLPSLLYTAALTTGSNSGPLDYVFDGYPKTLQVVRDSMTLSQLSTSDLSSISNVICAPASTTISDNQQLTSLSGLQFSYDDPSTIHELIISNNPQLFQSGMQPLGPVLQCRGNFSPLIITVTVANQDCLNFNNPLTSVIDVCSYLIAFCSGPSKTAPIQGTSANAP